VRARVLFVVTLTAALLLIALTVSSCDQSPRPQLGAGPEEDILRVSGCTMARLKTPQGWIVFGHAAAVYVPDSAHTWDWRKP